jgi:hypothetical protein
MKRYVFFLVFIISSHVVYAQFNDSVHHYVKYATTGIINQTNDLKSFVLNNNLGFSINRKYATLNNSNSWIYGKQGSRLTNNDVNSALNFDILKNVQKLYYWGLLNFTSSYSLKIRYQFQVGAGVGYNIINMEKVEIVVSDGIIFETSDLQLTPDARDVYHTFRNSLRLKHHLVIKDLIVLDGSHIWQPSLSHFNDYIIRSTTSLSIKLRKWLSIGSSLTYNKLSRTNRENLLFSFGLTAETYF